METFTGHSLVKDLKKELKLKFGTVKKAAEVIGISYYNLSRIIHGHHHELQTHVKILIALDYLADTRYIYPNQDLYTFELINGLRSRPKF